MGSFWGLFLVCHSFVSMSQSNLLSHVTTKAIDFKEVMCTHFSFKLSVSYIIRSMFSIASNNAWHSWFEEKLLKLLWIQLIKLLRVCKAHCCLACAQVNCNIINWLYYNKSKLARNCRRQLTN
jgi:hypothetical protein